MCAGTFSTPKCYYFGPPRRKEGGKGVREIKKKTRGRIFFLKDTPGGTTYLRNQARFYIRKYDVSGGGAQKLEMHQ